VKIAFAGYNGFIGSRFIKTYPDYNYIYLSREMLYSEPERLSEAIEGADVVISLTGYPIIKRWTAKNRSLIRKSRIEVNRNLAEAIRLSPRKPELFVSASAIGIYNHTGIHSEASTDYGSGFMPEVVKDWEGSTSNIRDVTGVAYLRIGMVLGNGGGAFTVLKKTTKMGLGAVIGTGRQMHSFIHIEDLIRAIDFIIRHRIDGPVNMVAPKPLDNMSFMKLLGNTLNRKVWLKIPKFAFKILLGNASEVMTEGQYVVPARLIEEGFEYKYASLEEIFLNLAGRK
jgi:uncharacterized protein